MSRRVILLIYVLNLLALMLLSKIFGYTAGLLWFDNKSEGIEYVIDLLSSGNDDNITISVGFYIFAVPLFFRLIQFYKPFNLIDMVVFIIAWLIQLVFLYFIEAGSILDTIYYGRNIILLLWMLIYLFSIIFVGHEAYRNMKEKKLINLR